MISKQGRLISTGTDDFGRINLFEHGQCGRCGRIDIHTVKYMGGMSKLNIPKYVADARNLIVKRTSKSGIINTIRLGIECGCYARFHRQVVHIQKGHER